MSLFDLLWEIAFLSACIVIIILSSRLRKKYSVKKKVLPFTFLIIIAAVFMALRIISLFV